LSKKTDGNALCTANDNIGMLSPSKWLHICYYCTACE